MSCDWNIRCLDCADDNLHRFDDANHMVGEMWALIRHHEAIAAIDDLMRDEIEIDFRLGCSGSHYGRIDTAWFRKHLGHRLWPISEYGELDRQCTGFVACSEGVQHKCQLESGHKGHHSSLGTFQSQNGYVRK